MTNLQLLHESFNQSPWLDNLSRELMQSGRLEQYVHDGIRGITSNPTILEHAITSDSLYDEDIKNLTTQGMSAQDIYWSIVIDDIKRAAQILRPLWNDSKGEDGYISLEVSPDLAADGPSTLMQAKELWARVDEPNLMIKVPATDQSIPVIKQLLEVGINVNVTLIFSLDHYKQVAAAHLATHQLELINDARSVASFFISRVDNEVDKRLEAIGTQEALNLRGKAAIAQARAAYGIFLESFAQTAVVDQNGAGVQRLLWASTSTKNPTYDDLLYVTSLVAPLTINTLPEETIANIVDHLSGELKSIELVDIKKAHSTLASITEVGVNFDDVTQTLESEGIQKFQSSFTALLDAIQAKMNA